MKARIEAYIKAVLVEDQHGSLWPLSSGSVQRFKVVASQLVDLPTQGVTTVEKGVNDLGSDKVGDLEIEFNLVKAVHEGDLNPLDVTYQFSEVSFNPYT